MHVDGGSPQADDILNHEVVTNVTHRGSKSSPKPLKLRRDVPTRQTIGPSILDARNVLGRDLNLKFVFDSLDSCYQSAYIRVGWPTVSHPLNRVGVVRVQGDDPSSITGGGDVDGYRRRKQFKPRNIDFRKGLPSVTSA